MASEKSCREQIANIFDVKSNEILDSIESDVNDAKDELEDITHDMSEEEVLEHVHSAIDMLEELSKKNYTRRK